MLRTLDNPLQSVDPELDEMMVEFQKEFGPIVRQTFQDVCVRLNGPNQWHFTSRACSFGSEGEIVIITTLKKAVIQGHAS